MQSSARRGRLVYPVAVILALGLINVPTDARTAAPHRMVELSAVRLQAEATSLVSGLAAGTAASVVAALPGAAAAGTADETLTCTYPCTPIDKFLFSLPVEIRNLLLPPLYVVGTIVGAVIGVVTLILDPIVRLFNPDAEFPFWAAASATAPAGPVQSASAEPSPGEELTGDDVLKDEGPESESRARAVSGTLRERTATVVANTDVTAPITGSVGAVSEAPAELSTVEPAAPVDEAPVAETSVAETPVAEIPVAESPVTETPAAEAPAEPAETAELSAVEGPAEPGPADIPADPVSADPAAADEAAADISPASVTEESDDSRQSSRRTTRR